MCNGGATRNAKNADTPDGVSPSSDAINTTTTVANSKLCFVLQTAKAIVKTPNTQRGVQARILFDNGSQRSYVTESLREKLKAPTVKSETLNLNTFGDKGFAKRKCDIVELKISKDGNNSINIKALTFPVICSKVSSKIEVQRYDHLRFLEFADNVDGENNDTIDILIGSDYYWNFVTGNVIKGKNGPVAVESTLGWIISGVSEELKGQKKDHKINTNLLVETEIGDHDRDSLSVTRSLLEYREHWYP